MSDLNVLGALGLSDDEDVIWPKTREAIERKGYLLKSAPHRNSTKIDEGAFAYLFGEMRSRLRIHS